MGKVTPEKAERIRQYVLDCQIKRFTADETTEYLKQRGFPIDVRTVKRYRARLREGARDWIAKLAKSKRAEYIAEYKERIDGIRGCQNRLWAIVDNEKTYDRNKIAALHELIDSEVKLVDFYDAIPILKAIRDFDECGYNHGKGQGQQQQQLFQQSNLSGEENLTGTDSLA